MITEISNVASLQRL